MRVPGTRVTSAGSREGAPLVLGHRGASAEAPENTLAAFRLAVEQGADGVELDVWRCRSGEVVVHHDPDLRRTAGLPLRVQAAAWQELRRADVGAWRGPRFRGERVPLLAEVLEAVPGALVNVELKSSGLPDAGLPAAVARVVRSARASDRCILSSFDPLLLALLRARAPSLRRGLLIADERGWRVRDRVGRLLLRPAAVHPQARLVDARAVADWRGAGLAVNVWTVDAPSELVRLAGLGVSAVITNQPALARRVLRGRSP